jgi:enolase-phosphatase E1
MNNIVQANQLIRFRDISHVLLDIEGTTCPVSYVAKTLFPYARTNIPIYLERKSEAPEIQYLLTKVRESWLQDQDETASGLRNQGGSLEQYLDLLITQDRKLTELKELQGMVWEEGYANGDLVGPLYADVPQALQDWHNQGIVLSVYSSGSITAQKLIYSNSNAGNLSHLFSHWFDTKTGIKNLSSSYFKIAETMGAPSSRILFISDSRPELEAARQAKMRTLFSSRDGNPDTECTGFPSISDYSLLKLEPHNNNVKHERAT